MSEEEMIDQTSEELMEEEKLPFASFDIYKKYAESWLNHIKDKEIDRRLLRESIFQNEYKRKQLQAIIFGFIKYEIVERLERKSSKIFLSVSILN